MELTKDQQLAFDGAKRFISFGTKSHYVIDGYAGTGKTYLISMIRKAYPNTKIAVAAYTGKACSVLKKKGIVDAQTIHSLIFNVVVIHGKYKFSLKEEIPYDIIIIDEASMVNEDFYQFLLSFNKPIIFVGDSYQLPPVEGRNYFNVMDTHDIRLQEIVRQAADNPIIKLATDVRAGSELFYLNLNNYGSNIRKIDGKTAYNSLNKYDVVIVATNRSRNDINHSVRNLLKYDPINPVKGDKIICRRNKKGADVPYNGQTFVLRNNAKRINDEYDMMIDCETDDGLDYLFKTNLLNFLEQRVDGKEETILNDDIFPFQYAYALTCHNSQGSEYDNVLVVNDLYMMPTDKLTKLRWSYTAITRAKEKLDIVDFGDLKGYLKYNLFGEEI